MKRYVLHVCCLDKHISCQRVAATCRTLERISRFVGKKLARIQQCSIKVLHVLIPWKGTKENSQTACHHYDNFLTGLLIGLGGSHLALFAAEFSVESCYLPYLLRETDQQPGQKSIWAKSHLLKSGNQWRSKQLQGTFGRTPSRTKMVAKVWLTYQMDTFQVTTKPGKKNMLWFPSGFES